MNDHASANGNLERPDGSAVAQAAFNAAWDLRTEWRRKRQICAADYAARLGVEVFAWPEVQYALAVSERIARQEAGELPSELVPEWLRANLTDRVSAYSRLLKLLGTGPDGRPQGPPSQPDTYPYLFPSSSGSGELGRLGDFRVIREIGRGGMGVVFEVEAKNLC